MTTKNEIRASVVIPTFNRLADLRAVIAAVIAQTGTSPWPCTVIVVDDGSNDGTADWLDTCGPDLGLTVLHQSNSGPARARNRGVEAAEGELVLFLGDDTEPQPGWLLEHLEAHRMLEGGPDTAVLGYTGFPPGHATPFLRWINEHGAQFGYALIDRPTDVPFNFFYTSNVSVPRAVFERLGGFREDFPAAAWEDIELAYRATSSGMKLRYLPRARCLHHHRIRVGSFCARQETSGRSAAIFASLHPELEGFLGVGCVRRPKWIDGPRRAALRAWVALGEVVPGLASHRVYRRLIDEHYLCGLSRGLQTPLAAPPGAAEGAALDNGGDHRL
jgi:GT2 family glycosyltransferase